MDTTVSANRYTLLFPNKFCSYNVGDWPRNTSFITIVRTNWPIIVTYGRAVQRNGFKTHSTARNWQLSLFHGLLCGLLEARKHVFCLCIHWFSLSRHFLHNYHVCSRPFLYNQSLCSWIKSHNFIYFYNETTDYANKHDEVRLVLEARRSKNTGLNT